MQENVRASLSIPPRFMRWENGNWVVYEGTKILFFGKLLAEAVRVLIDGLLQDQPTSRFVASEDELPKKMRGKAK